MQKLSSFGRGKQFRPKKSLTSLLHAALQEYNSTGNELSCKSYCDVYRIRFGAKQVQYERVVQAIPWGHWRHSSLFKAGI